MKYLCTLVILICLGKTDSEGHFYYNYTLGQTNTGPYWIFAAEAFFGNQTICMYILTQVTKKDCLASTDASKHYM